MNGLWKAGQSKNCVHGLCRSPVHPNLSCLSPTVEGELCVGKWSLKHGPREGTDVGCEKTA